MKRSRGLRQTEVMLATCGFFEVAVSDLLGRKRTQTISLARQVCMYLLSEFTTLSNIEIGMTLSRGEATVRHGIDYIKRKRRRDRDLDIALKRIRSVARGRKGADSARSFLRIS